MERAADTVREPEGPFARREPDVVELSLLLPGWQIDALESAARRHGLTTGQMLRRWISDKLAQLPLPAGDPAI
jgi:hypothetical protein